MALFKARTMEDLTEIESIGVPAVNMTIEELRRVVGGNFDQVRELVDAERADNAERFFLREEGREQGREQGLEQGLARGQGQGWPRWCCG